MLLLSSSSLASLFRPWIGVVVAYLMVILVPQSIWWWALGDVRPVLWVLLPTIVGCVLCWMRGQLNFAIIRNRQTFYVAALWLCFFLSYFLGPYVDVPNYGRFYQPDWALSHIHKMILLYFLACLCIDSEAKLRVLTWVIVCSGLYLIYWANDMYLSGRVFGRLAGPTGPERGSVYTDENNFSMIFVIVIPYLWYMGTSSRSKLIKWGLWLAIPFGWHAVFLTGSRGGLVGIAVTTLLVAWRSRNRYVGALLIPALALAYIYQAGDVMRERANSMSGYESESSASARLDSWSTAVAMIVEHPATGVGLSSFSTAYPDFSESRPLEAHSTVLQIAAESGAVAGLMYLLIVIGCLTALWRNGNLLRKAKEQGGSHERLHSLNEATLASFAGLVVCSLFLSLHLFEIFYCLVMMANAVLYVSRHAMLRASDSPATMPSSSGTSLITPGSAGAVANSRPSRN